MKYKTAKLECGEILLHNHGAVDLGRFDFLWDVNRLELLVNNDKKSSIEQAIYKNKSCSFECSHLKRCDKGFAVLLTNEQKYWKENWVKETESSDCTIDNQFKFGEKDFTNTGQLYGNKLNWKLEDDRSYPKTIRGKSGTGTFRARPIELLQAYKYKWEKYPTKNPSDKNNEFRYLIIDVERNI